MYIVFTDNVWLGRKILVWSGIPEAVRYRKVILGVVIGNGCRCVVGL